jgi:hypothetical protein
VTGWEIVAQRWERTDDGLTTLGPPTVMARAASQGMARRVTQKLNVAGSGLHWSIRPAGEQDDVEAKTDGAVPAPAAADAAGV